MDAHLSHLNKFIWTTVDLWTALRHNRSPSKYLDSLNVLKWQKIFWVVFFVLCLFLLNRNWATNTYMEEWMTATSTFDSLKQKPNVALTKLISERNEIFKSLGQQQLFSLFFFSLQRSYYIKISQMISNLIRADLICR